MQLPQREFTLAKECDYVQVIPKVKEACALDLAPTPSTTAVLAFGDAFAVAVSNYYHLTEKDFAVFHPEGALGKKILIRIEASFDKANQTSIESLYQLKIATDIHEPYQA